MRTFIEREVIRDALLVCNAELYPNYQIPGSTETCLAVHCDGRRDLIQFLIEVAVREPELATNLNDDWRKLEDDRGMIYFFSSYDLEPDDPEDDEEEEETDGPHDS